MSYPKVQLFIDGRWKDGNSGEEKDVRNPLNEGIIGTVAFADEANFREAAESAERGHAVWSKMSAFERSKILRRAAELLRERIDTIARILTLDEGKPLIESRAEVNSSADLLDWFAEEGRRTYGRIIPSRGTSIQQTVVRRPVGPVIGLTPWNFPMSQIVRKLGPALAAGCAVVIKGPQEAPGSPAQLFKALQDAGLPAGAANLIYGNSAAISNYFIPHPIIKKVSFTGSVPVGKQLAALAGMHMKRATMELGGHAPVIIMDDADIDLAATVSVAMKYRNAGQVCNAPTRFLVQDRVHDRFVEAMSKRAGKLKVGDGLSHDTDMGPLFSRKQVSTMEALIEDAVHHGAKVETGGRRIGNQGYLFEPTVLTGMTPAMRAMNEEPFGPIALISRFSDLDEALVEANRLPFGLASYAWTKSANSVHRISSTVRAGMLSINHQGLGIPETPYGGILESGYGYEGGTEALEPYTITHFISHETAA